MNLGETYVLDGIDRQLLDALQTGGLCPANWTSADGNIDPEKALRPGRILGHYRIRESVVDHLPVAIVQEHHLKLALVIEQHGDVSLSEVLAHYARGILHDLEGEYDAALEVLTQSLEIHRDVADRARPEPDDRRVASAVDQPHPAFAE